MTLDFLHQEAASRVPIHLEISYLWIKRVNNNTWIWILTPPFPRRGNERQLDPRPELLDSFRKKGVISSLRQRFVGLEKITVAIFKPHVLLFLWFLHE